MKPHLPCRRWWSALAVVPVAVGVLAAGPAAQAADPPFLGWTAVLPALATDYQPNSSDDCVAGRVACVKRTIAAMQTRFDPLAASCDHAAVFALAYLRTTQTYLDAPARPAISPTRPLSTMETRPLPLCTSGPSTTGTPGTSSG